MSSTLVEQRRPTQSPQVDPSTLSNYQHFDVKHTSLSMYVDWENKKVNGLVNYQLNCKDTTTKVVLDSSFIDVHNVKINNEEARFFVGDRVEPLGSALTITSENIHEVIDLQVDFSTTDQCTALQWLDKEQTDGKVAPYLFSQSQAIHGRALFPCFDTPAIKSTYSMTISSKHNALASGVKATTTTTSEKTPAPHHSAEKDSAAEHYRYVQNVPIPSYLFAIASGDISAASIGPRSSVFSEPCKLQANKWEFEQDTEPMIQAAEKIVFDYEWKEYNSLVMPISFPYGGMEVPNCNLLNNTVVSGDRMNVNVVAHELAHSWSGNLVTNASWEHFWLNEGWTVYLERRILGLLNGESYRQFHAIIGWQDLETAVSNLTKSGNEGYTQLVVDLQNNQDPDDAFSTVPYEKGFNFLYMLENLLEGWDQFIPYYFKKFRYISLDSYQFKDTLYEYFTQQKDKLDSVDWDTWYYTPGLPPKPQFDTSLADACYKLADKWIEAAKSGKSENELVNEFSKTDLENWTTTQMGVFIDTVINEYEKLSTTTTEAVKAMNRVYSFASSNNAEVISRWYHLAIDAKLESQYKPLGNWLGGVGRMKFVRPGYKLLNKVDRQLALDTFKSNETLYHPICKAMVMKDLDI